MAMNETLQRFLRANAYQLIVAVISIIVTAFATYVGFRLFEQSTTFELQAMQKDITNLQDNTVRRNELEPINKKLDEIHKDVDTIIEYLINQ